ncbi:hypothetical protein R1sor_002023 [Riccia sorocarpa]|uniref:Reverse transcriptase zinc-binding domain-containing protein n=1 Tax=Riccia sorocarpa TaxID=122646 RepID=A0ABD3GZK9_9MARC
MYTSSTTNIMAPSRHDQAWDQPLDIAKLQAEHKARVESTRRRNPCVFRVPPFIRELRPRAYDANFITSGLFHRNFKQGMSSVDRMKLEVLGCFLELLEINQDRWKTFCEQVTVQPTGTGTPGLEYFYDNDGSYSCLTLEAIRSILVTDACFIVAWIIRRPEPRGKSVSDDRPRFFRHIMDIFRRGSVQSGLNAFDFDICWLCEGQIPLFLVKNLWERVQSALDLDDYDASLRAYLNYATAYAGVPSRYLHDSDLEFDTCDHLLDCLYKTLSWVDDSVIRRRDEQQELKDEEPQKEGRFKSYIGRVPVGRQVLKFVEKLATHTRRVLSGPQYRKRTSLPSAVQLARSGIRFEGTLAFLSDIQFVKSPFRLSATLYIPRMTVDDYTEKALLNMCMYESWSRKDEGMHEYVLLMDALIETEKDVELLSEGKNPVIEANDQDTKQVVNTFTNTLQNFTYPSKRSLGRYDAIQKEMVDWYTNPWRRQLVAFLDRFRVQPWLVVSLYIRGCQLYGGYSLKRRKRDRRLAATFLLILTVLQTVYTSPATGMDRAGRNNTDPIATVRRMDMALKIGVSDGICPRCRAGIESVDHLFWSCSRSKNRWDLLKRVTAGTRNDMRHVNEWFDFKILTLRLKNTDATLWAIAAELYRVLWRERNDLVFRGKRLIRPLRAVVHETSRSVSAWITKSMPDRHKTLAVNTLETLLHLEIRLEPQAHPPNLVSTLHDSHEDLLQVNIDTQTWRPGELSL